MAFDRNWLKGGVWGGGVAGELYCAYHYKGVVSPGVCWWQQNLSQQASEHSLGIAFRFRPLLHYYPEWLVLHSSSALLEVPQALLPNFLLSPCVRWIVSSCWSLSCKNLSEHSWQVQKKNVPSGHPLAHSIWYKDSDLKYRTALLVFRPVWECFASVMLPYKFAMDDTGRCCNM